MKESFHFINLSVFQILYLPGDNDIGGEGFDLREARKISRFYKYFEKLDVLTHQNMELVQVIFQYRKTVLKI